MNFIIFILKKKVGKSFVFENINERQKIFLYIINETINIDGFLRDLVQIYKHREIIINKNNYYHILRHYFNISSLFILRSTIHNLKWHAEIECSISSL